MVCVEKSHGFLMEPYLGRLRWEISILLVHQVILLGSLKQRTECSSQPTMEIMVASCG